MTGESSTISTRSGAGEVYPAGQWWAPSMTMLSSSCIAPPDGVAWAHEDHTLEYPTLERKRDAIP